MCMNFLSLKIGNIDITPPGGIPPPSTDTVGKVLRNGITLFLAAGIIASIFVIVWGGINWITSGGEKQKLASAKARITWAIIGLVVMLTSFIIIRLINYFLEIDLLIIPL